MLVGIWGVIRNCCGELTLSARRNAAQGDKFEGEEDEVVGVADEAVF